MSRTPWKLIKKIRKTLFKCFQIIACMRVIKISQFLGFCVLISPIQTAFSYLIPTIQKLGLHYKFHIKCHFFTWIETFYLESSHNLKHLFKMKHLLCQQMFQIWRHLFQSSFEGNSIFSWFEAKFLKKINTTKSFQLTALTHWWKSIFTTKILEANSVIMRNSSRTAVLSSESKIQGWEHAWQGNWGHTPTRLYLPLVSMKTRAGDGSG